MAKERMKNLLLVFLIIMNFFLGAKILDEKELWPKGYNLFSNILSFNFFDNIKSYFEDTDVQKTKIFAPEKIVINTGDQTTRVSLNSADGEFEPILSKIELILKKALEQEDTQAVIVDEEEVFSALKQESVYLEYAYANKVKILAKMLNAQNNAVSDEQMSASEIVILNNSRRDIYICESKNNKYYKISLKNEDDELGTYIEEEILDKSTNNEVIINYSHDLGFHKPFGTQKTTLNPFIQIYSRVPDYRVINSQNPIMVNGEINEDVIYDILEVFSINSSSTRRYTQAGGTVVFVENDATLKIDKNGYLEYTATDGGIELSQTGDEYTTLLNLSSLSKRINKVASTDAKLRLGENKKEIPDGIIFDYVIAGLAVKVENDLISSGVEAIVSDGYLKSYKQLIRKYSITDKKYPLTEFFTALDDVIAGYKESMNEIYIDKMYFGYTDNGEIGEKTADWIVSVDNVIVQ